jgi:hypothetical protein
MTSLFRGVLTVVCIGAAGLVVPAGPASATPAVQPPTMVKSFSPTTIALGEPTLLFLEVSNPNAQGTLTGVGFVDELPSGLVATPGTDNDFCDGGVLTITATTISLTGATISPGVPCNLGVNVQATTLGVKINATTATSTNAGAGPPATATVAVGAPPIITKAFVAPTIALGASTAMTLTLVNFNTAPLTGAAFTDMLPPGLAVASPNGLSNTCGGTATAAAGGGSIALTGGTIPASSNCVVSVNVRGTSAGFWTNSTSAVTTAEGLTSFPGSASLTVVAPPTLTKAFSPSTVPVGATTRLTFTLTNPNPTITLSRMTFADPLPSGLAVSANPAVIDSCGGVPSVGPFALAVAYANARLPGNVSCTFSVNVTATSAGVKNNTTTIVTSTPGGIGRPATASITVTP